MQALQDAIERVFALGAQAKSEASAREVFLEFRSSLSRGKIRAAEKRGNQWYANVWVKQGILLGFRLGELAEMGSDATLSFVDKDTFPARRWHVGDGIRIVPGGSSVRKGAYVPPSVICMPPMYINLGSYVVEAPLVNSHPRL